MRSRNVKVKWNSSGVIQAVTRSSKDSIIDIISEIDAISKDLVPVEMGDLKASGRHYMDGDTGIVIYDAEHALIQHEDLDFHHEDGQSAKYLENAYNKVLPHMAAKMQIVIAKDLK